MALNYPLVFLTGLIPLLTGFVWYNPKVFGNIWMKAAGVTPEQGKKMNMLVVFGLTYLFSLMLSMILFSIVIHQTHLYSILLDTPGFGQENSDVMNYIEEFMGKYSGNYRTFKHGALHGTIAGVFIALPLIAINAMFEMKGFKYVAVNAGYWILNLMLMGGIICAFG
ncbi:MAG: DUF1761 domain-containing protein [Haliscomenobacter sp.]|uniref:DUF1761 domain-containing protein n=1 Tax=Haliscomenobacter sp. TaxID=2717303 RepID=UPI0029B23D0E|nr:DUF1761 domain-containing protein [Haliscomenobacter sp.]MDX2069805.1 DUF1761 domain-containing protein [Haliscomenobacter sp.]